MKKNTAKRALSMSVIALLLCVSMLVGTTFAWFTDSVTSANNIIQSGNLDVELEYWNGTEWVDITGRSDILTNSLWEPGVTEVAYLRVTNAGSLVLKYQLGINIVKEVAGVNKAGEELLLSDHIMFGVKDLEVTAEKPFATYATREDAVAALDSAAVISTGYNKLIEEMMPAEERYLALVVYMPETVANAANHNGTNIPQIDLGINVFATQKDSEEDSFGPDYDQYALPVTNTEELLDRLANAVPGEKIYMAAGEYALTEALVLPSNVSLYGVQVGKAAKNWVNNDAAAKTVIKSTGSNVLEIRQSSDDPAEAAANVTIDGIMIDCADKNVKGIYVKKSGGEAIEGIRITNCAVVNSTNDGIDVCNAYGAIIENNYVSNVKDTAIHLGNYNGYHYETWAEVTAYVRNNVITNVTATENGAIQIENGMGDVVVSGNVIQNVTAGSPVGSSSVKASAIHVYDVYEGGEILIEKNTIENADQGIAIYKYTYNTVMGESWWEGPTSDNDIVTVSGNTISGFKTFGIATSTLNHKNNQSNATLVKITGNTLTSSAASEAITTDNTGSVTKTNNTFNGNGC